MPPTTRKIQPGCEPGRLRFVGLFPTRRQFLPTMPPTENRHSQIDAGALPRGHHHQQPTFLDKIPMMLYRCRNGPSLPMNVR